MESKIHYDAAHEYHQKANKFCSAFPNSLDTETLKIIHATAPVVASQITEITATFYLIMLNKYPITKTLFNPTHFLPEAQSGKTPQSVALGEAIVKGCNFLTHFEGFKTQGFLELTAQKHCALGVKAEHYPIVHECFMEAVAKVLGEAVTPEVADAWSKVVLYQARAYIEREADIYRKMAEVGGWMGFKNFLVSDIKKETSEITSYTFKSVEKLPKYTPGSYIAIRMNNVGDSPSHIRTYSLTEAPDQSSFSISVKTERARTLNIKDIVIDAPDGLFSNLLAERLKVGDTVELSSPFGNFGLKKEQQESNEPLVFLAGGIGVTPVLSMLKVLTKSRSKAPIYVLYSVKNSKFHAFDETFKSMMKNFPNVKYHVLYTEPQTEDKQGINYDVIGCLTPEIISSFVGENVTKANYYICGDPIIRPCIAFLKQLTVPPEQVHYEYFGPLGTGMV